MRILRESVIGVSTRILFAWFKYLLKSLFVKCVCCWFDSVLGQRKDKKLWISRQLAILRLQSFRTPSYGMRMTYADWIICLFLLCWKITKIRKLCTAWPVKIGKMLFWKFLVVFFFSIVELVDKLYSSYQSKKTWKCNAIVLHKKNSNFQILLWKLMIFEYI